MRGASAAKRKKNYFCGGIFFAMSVMTKLALALTLNDPHDDA